MHLIDGSYTTKSAYKMQLQGTYSDGSQHKVWKAFAEGKVKFFAWVLLQRKILTADLLSARHWQGPATYPLCDKEPETTCHLCLQCYFAREVWFLIGNWMGWGAGFLSTVATDIQDWWNQTLQPLKGKEKRSAAAVLMYATWNVWKERDRRIFESKALRADQVSELIKQDILLRRRACATPLIREDLHPLSAAPFSCFYYCMSSSFHQTVIDNQNFYSLLN